MRLDADLKGGMVVLDGNIGDCWDSYADEDDITGQTNAAMAFAEWVEENYPGVSVEVEKKCSGVGGGFWTEDGEETDDDDILWSEWLETL